MKTEFQKKLSKAKIGIAGAGGLGSNCAVSLARVGVGNLVIADFDTIDESNLNRQYFFYDQIGQKKVFALKHNIKRINPKIKIVALDIKLEPKDIVKIYKDCDIIVEAFDLSEMKHMIIETVLTEFPEKHLISGVGLAGWGENNLFETIKSGNLYFSGDRKTEVSEKLPPLAPRVGIVANMQANLVLELILGKIIEKDV